MTKFERVLSDAELISATFKAEVEGTMGELRAVEQAVLAKLAEQEPIVKIDCNGDTVCPKKHSLKLLDLGTKLYAHPIPTIDQEPVAWRITAKRFFGDFTKDKATAQWWKDAEPESVTPLYANPMPNQARIKEALRFAAQVIELYDDATLVSDNYMLTSTDCAEIIKELVDYIPCVSTAIDKTACVSESGESETQVSSRVNFDSSKGCDDSLNLELARHQPCGCVVCYCENQVQCLGCGAEHCGTHDLGKIPNPVYTNHFAGVRNMAECAKCGHPAIHYLVMDNLGYPNKTPFCGDCAQEHEQLAQDTNEHEIRNFGGAYGLVAYHYEPLGATQPDHIPDTSKMVFDPDAALTLAERTLNIEITEPLADEIVQFACKLHEKYAQADHIPDAGKMLNLSLSVDTKETQALLQSYLDSLDGWQLMPKKLTDEMHRSAVNFIENAPDCMWIEYISSLYNTLLATAPKPTEVDK